jgi:predicted dinucleotide-binding enzyme
MKIGIIGSGMIGGTTARLLVAAGHQVALSNSRGPESLKEQVEGLGPNARAATIEEACRFGEVVLVAIPFGAYSSLPAAALQGKIVIDAMNYYPGRDGKFDVGAQGSSALVAKHLPGARVVKAFNTMNFKPLGTRGDAKAPADQRLALFVAGDEAAAKCTVAGLIEQVGFAAIDVGSLADGRRVEPGSPVYNRPMPAPDARKALGQG